MSATDLGGGARATRRGEESRQDKRPGEGGTIGLAPMPSRPQHGQSAGPNMRLNDGHDILPRSSMLAMAIPPPSIQSTFSIPFHLDSGLFSRVEPARVLPSTLSFTLVCNQSYFLLFGVRDIRHNQGLSLPRYRPRRVLVPDERMS